MPQDEKYYVPGGGYLWIPGALDHQAKTCRVIVEMSSFFDSELGSKVHSRYKVDDIVIIGKFTGTIVTLDRTPHIICRESDVICRLLPLDSADDQAKELEA